MPKLAEATAKSIEELGYTRVEQEQSINRTAPPTVMDNSVAYSRCPVPPFSISPDSLTTYNQNGLAPQARIIAALPTFQDQTSSTSTKVTEVVSSGGGSGSSSSTVVSSTPVPAQAGFTTAAISPGNPLLVQIQLAPLFILYQVTVSSPARVELYSTAAAQLQDQGRSPLNPVPLGSENGVIVDLNLAGANESPWLCSPAPTGFNGDSPISSTIYTTITNVGTSTVPITISLSYLPLGVS